MKSEATQKQIQCNLRMKHNTQGSGDVSEEGQLPARCRVQGLIHSTTKNQTNEAKLAGTCLKGNLQERLQQ